MRKNVAFIAIVSILAACGSSSSKTDLGSDPGVPDVGSDVPIVDVQTPDVPERDVVEDSPAVDLIPDVPSDPGWETVTPPLPFGAENRGYKELRGVVHMHSNWSHDGCFPQHEAVDPSLLVVCETEHRDAGCLSGMDFVMQTDHPSNVRDATFEQALHYRAEAGDVLVNDSKGRLTANRVTCPGGSLVPSYLYFVGTEGSKQMPIGLTSPIPAQIFDTSFDDSVPLDQVQAAIATVHSGGGYAFVCHPEQDDLSVERIKAAPLDGIEIFNFHPMLMDALQQNLEQFIRMDAFMTPGKANPVPDLAILLLLQPVYNDPMKFDQSSPFIRLTAFGASDIHRNVEIPQLCTDLDSCGSYTYDYPNFAQLLVTGGPAMLADGDRMDSFKRAFRWMSNHTRVSKDKAGDVDEVRTSIGQGRSYVAFDLMGIPTGFDFFAVADGNPVEMGQEIKAAAKVGLYLKSPTLAAPPWGIPYVDAGTYGQATMRTKVYQATAAGSDLILDQPGQGREFELAAVAPGAYRVEVWITPTHLVPALNGIESIAQSEVPYLYSNAIFVRP